jgi:hypothetical protein
MIFLLKECNILLNGVYFCWNDNFLCDACLLYEFYLIMSWWNDQSSVPSQSEKLNEGEMHYFSEISAEKQHCIVNIRHSHIGSKYTSTIII